MNAGKGVAAYWQATFRGQLAESELKVFERVLAFTDLRDAQAAIDEIAARGGFPPTAQEIAALANVKRKERQTEERPELPPSPRERYLSFSEWVRDYATDAEKATIEKVAPSLKERFGGTLEELAG